MKSNFRVFINIIMATVILCAMFATGCNGSGSKEYAVQYTDGSGTHSLTVTYGMPYSLDNIPEKTGYEFIGLFDSETGGTQYVAANGSSLAPFSDKSNKVLFPQFKQRNILLF